MEKGKKTKTVTKNYRAWMIMLSRRLICLSVVIGGTGKGLTERLDFVPVITTGEDATQAEDDN